MNRTNKRILIILSIVGLIFVIILTFFIFMLAYESREDVSDQEPYSSYLNHAIEIKHISTIRWNKEALRFSNYSLHENEDSNINLEEVKSVKRYLPGDKIVFHSAKEYKSMHIGATYYLIGKDTLDNGEPIEFEYYFKDKHSFNIWETKEEFLKRIKVK